MPWSVHRRGGRTQSEGALLCNCGATTPVLYCPLDYVSHHKKRLQQSIQATVGSRQEESTMTDTHQYAGKLVTIERFILDQQSEHPDATGALTESAL